MKIFWFLRILQIIISSKDYMEKRNNQIAFNFGRPSVWENVVKSRSW